MTKRFCDKCGIEIIEYNFQETSFPLYEIKRKKEIMSPFSRIDLCQSCIKKFDKWLNFKEQEDDKNNL